LTKQITQMNRSLKLQNSYVNMSELIQKQIKIGDDGSSSIFIFDWADLLDKTSHDLFAGIGKTEISRAKKINHLRRRKEFIVARQLTRQTLSKVYANQDNSSFTKEGQGAYMAPADWNIQETSLGKPQITNENIQNLNFNISHSDQYLVIGITKREKIGIDIEPIQPALVDPFPAQLFSKNEIEKLKSLKTNEQPKFFTKLWTSKEAIAKYTGVGGAVDFSKIGIKSKNKSLYGEINQGQKIKLMQFLIKKHTKQSIMTVALH